MRRKHMILTTLVAALAAALVVVASGVAGTDRSTAADPAAPAPPAVERGAPVAAGPALKACPGDDSTDFDTYSVGAKIGAVAQSRVQRVCEPLYSGAGAAPTRVNSRTVIYGTCTPEAGTESCGFPLTVESWPACERNLSLYSRYPAPDGSTVPYEKTTVRGVPAAVFDEGHRIEVYTGDATIVVSAGDPKLALAAAKALKGTHAARAVAASDDLPAPAAGATAGKLAC